MSRSHYDRVTASITRSGRSIPPLQKIADATKSLETLEHMLKGLSKEEASDVKAIVSSDPDFTPEVALVLSKDEDLIVRLNVARNSSTPTEVLIALVRDPKAIVRMGVADNPNTPAEVLAIIASDEDLCVSAFAESIRRKKESC
jgi:hypothetical protein